MKKSPVAQVDVLESLDASMNAILTEYNTNEQTKANKIAEQANVETFLVQIGCPREEFAAASRTQPVVVAATPRPRGPRGRKPSKTTTTTTAVRASTPSEGGGTQSEYILNWFANQPNQTASIRDLKNHFSQVGRSANTAAVMVTNLTKAGLLKAVERGVYARTKKAA